MPELVFSGQLFIAVPLAILAGIVSFASPCVLPLVPAYLAYVTGTTGHQVRRARPMLGVSLFVLGFTIVFVAYGALFGTIGSWLTQWQDLITRILGIAVTVMGFAFLGFIPFFQRTARLNMTPAVGLTGAPLLGVAFGLGWTPCFGPTLVAISALSLESGSAGRGALLGVAYCVGLGVPFLLLTFGFGWVARTVAFLRNHLRVVNVIGGTIMVVLGLLMVSGLWTMAINHIQGWIGGFVLPI
ncbi:cytochrome c biogenesis CcdA family protein [Paramicrobacterium agarici]|uniref:cytochrome c biogenesis CcdA family protein n=1 Tax=Paramicrobacterium agarici TaxID=630514 RepID=UPI001151C80E|nr:cytochrome c biogenesis protein CcdA [Microbacterium agarici]